MDQTLRLHIIESRSEGLGIPVEKQGLVELARKFQGKVVYDSDLAEGIDTFFSIMQGDLPYPDFLHFCGHGKFEIPGAPQPPLPLLLSAPSSVNSSKQYDPNHIYKAFKTVVACGNYKKSNIFRLLFFNACNTEDFCHQLSAVLPLSVIIGWSTRCEDRACVAFATKFYDTLFIKFKTNSKITVGDVMLAFDLASFHVNEHVLPLGDPDNNGSNHAGLPFVIFGNKLKKEVSTVLISSPLMSQTGDSVSTQSMGPTRSLNKQNLKPLIQLASENRMSVDPSDRKAVASSSLATKPLSQRPLNPSAVLSTKHSSPTKATCEQKMECGSSIIPGASTSSFLKPSTAQSTDNHDPLISIPSLTTSDENTFQNQPFRTNSTGKAVSLFRSATLDSDSSSINISTDLRPQKRVRLSASFNSSMMDCDSNDSNCDPLKSGLSSPSLSFAGVPIALNNTQNSDLELNIYTHSVLASMEDSDSSSICRDTKNDDAPPIDPTRFSRQPSSASSNSSKSGIEQLSDGRFILKAKPYVKHGLNSKEDDSGPVSNISKAACVPLIPTSQPVQTVQSSYQHPVSSGKKSETAGMPGCELNNGVNIEVPSHAVGSVGHVNYSAPPPHNINHDASHGKAVMSVNFNQMPGGATCYPSHLLPVGNALFPSVNGATTSFDERCTKIVGYEHGSPTEKLLTTTTTTVITTTTSTYIDYQQRPLASSPYQGGVGVIVPDRSMYRGSVGMRNVDSSLMHRIAPRSMDSSYLKRDNNIDIHGFNSAGPSTSSHGSTPPPARGLHGSVVSSNHPPRRHLTSQIATVEGIAEEDSSNELPAHEDLPREGDHLSPPIGVREKAPIPLSSLTIHVDSDFHAVAETPKKAPILVRESHERLLSQVIFPHLSGTGKIMVPNTITMCQTVVNTVMAEMPQLIAKDPLLSTLHPRNDIKEKDKRYKELVDKIMSVFFIIQALKRSPSVENVEAYLGDYNRHISRYLEEIRAIESKMA